MPGVIQAPPVIEVVQPELLDRFAAILGPRRFDMANPPVPARTVYALGNITISTPGNLTVIAALPKAGKSVFVGGFIAAATGLPGDTLGMVSSNPNQLAVVHLDTEQSPADYHAILKTGMRRVGIAIQPAWLRSYRLLDVPMLDRFPLLEYELARAHREHGGIHSIVLDGIADFVVDPNDTLASFGLVEKLIRLTVKYDTSAVCVLHFNPGAGNDYKGRGHLGSQLERKAETVLTLEKTIGVTTAYTKMARHARVEKPDGSRFAWDNNAGMHLSCGTARVEQGRVEDFKLQAIVDEAFSGRASLRYTELIAEVMRIKRVKVKTAEKFVAKLSPKYVHKTELEEYCKV